MVKGFHNRKWNLYTTDIEEDTRHNNLCTPQTTTDAFIFPSREMQYNQSYIFNELDKVNSLRNRIAHHETICFATNTSTINTSYVINIYHKIKTLFSWMDIDSNSLLYGLDHINRVCSQINQLKAGI